MALMVTLNESVRTMAGRFDTFQRTVDERLTRLSNEQLLMKSKLEFLEKNCLPRPDTSHVLSQYSCEKENRGLRLNVFDTYYAGGEQSKAASIDDTEEYLKRVQQRFDEAKRIMQEANLF
jgi:hypothetical protein